MFELVAAAVDDGLAQVRIAQEQKRYIGPYYSWPRLSYRDNGMPQLFVANFGGPTDYKSIFQPLVGPVINYREIPSFQALIDYGRSQPRIREHYSVQDEEGPLSDLFDSHVTLIAIRLVDRYLHIYGDAPFEKALLLPLYLPIERFLLTDPLYVNIVVPILFLNFDFDIKALNEQAFVART